MLGIGFLLRPETNGQVAEVGNPQNRLRLDMTERIGERGEGGEAGLRKKKRGGGINNLGGGKKVGLTTLIVGG